MSSGSGPPPGRRYEIRIAEHLDDHWSTWFGAPSLTHEDGSTTLHGAVADQAELHGILAKLRDLGVTLLSVTVTEAPVGQGRRRPGLTTATTRAEERR